MKKKNTTTILLIAAFLVGLSLLLYPTVADYWNSFHQSTAIASYMDEVAEMDNDKYEEVWQSANEYNRRVAEKGNIWIPDEEQLEDYMTQLNVSASGIMGYIDIPTINCKLPIYHGTEEAVLQVGVGHIEGSSLPVGGESTHAVLSGHRGLPSAKLFTDLDKLTEGDTFYLQILDETLTYKIEKILIVKPYEVDALKIEQGRDLCTLVTCTPYGINSHRMLVQATRVETVKEAQIGRVPADAMQIEPIIVAPVVGAVMLVILLVVWLLSMRIGRRKTHD